MSLARGTMEGSALVSGVLEAMADGVILSDANGQIVYVSRSAEQLSGYSAADLVGRRIEVLVPAPRRGSHETYRERYLGAPTPRGMGSDLDIRLRRRDGTELPVDIALSTLDTEEETLAVAVIRDVSAKRKAERAVQEQALLLELAHDSVLTRRPDGTIMYWNQGAVETYGYSRREAMGKIAHDLLKTVFPQSRAEQEQALSLQGRWDGELLQTRKDDSPVTVSSRQVLVREEGGDPSLVFEINRDISDEKRAHERIEAVLEVAQAILAGRDAQSVLELIAHRARILVGAALATIALPEAGSDWFVVRVAEGEFAAGLLGMRLPAGNSIIARVLASHTPTVVADLATDSHAYPEFAKAAGMGPALFVPLTEGHDLGTLMVANPPGHSAFSASELTLIQLFAAAAAVAVEYTRVRETLQRLAVFEDRERIGRELHDGAIQRLFAVGMGLQSIALRVDDKDVAGRLKESVSEVDQVIRDLRDYIFGLRPALLHERQLDEALHRLATEFERVSGVVAVVDVDPEAASAIPEKSFDLLQLATEALSNVRRHAQAQTCRISLWQENGSAVLEIEDDGRGFDPTTAAGHGHGLRNFRERTTKLGGELTIESAVGQGTTVRVALPL